MKKMVFLLAIVMGVTLGYQKAQTAEPVYVGLNEVRSGPFRMTGDRVLSGLEVAIKELNKAGGVLGRPVELVVEDNQLKPEIALQKLRKMIQSDKCEVIIQGSSSAVSQSLSQVMPRYKKPLLAVCSFAMDLTGKHFNPFVFRTDANAAMMTKSMALYIGKQKKEFKKVYMINQDYSFGHDVADFYERFIRDFSGYPDRGQGFPSHVYQGLWSLSQ